MTSLRGASPTGSNEQGFGNDGVDGPRRHRLCQNEVVADLRQWRPSVEQVSRIGMDTSKHFFQLHGVNAAEKVVLRKKLRAIFARVQCSTSSTLAQSTSRWWK